MRAGLRIGWRRPRTVGVSTMNEAAIDLVVGWLDAVHLESAEERLAEAQAGNRARDGAIGATGEADMQRLAIHEASHAVLAYFLGARITRVCARADGSGCVDGH